MLLEYYLFNINSLSEEQTKKCLSLMTEQRKEYLERLSNKKRKQQTVAAEWLAKTTVAGLLSLKTEDIIIERDKKGKPFVKDSDIHISISHSGDFVALAVDAKPVGIDIEVIRPLDLSVAKKVCNDSDNILLNSSGSKERLNTFFKIWTAKEAYFKKKGTGITDMKSVSYKETGAVHYFTENLIITLVK